MDSQPITLSSELGELIELTRRLEDTARTYLGGLLTEPGVQGRRLHRRRERIGHGLGHAIPVGVVPADAAHIAELRLHLASTATSLGMVTMSAPPGASQINFLMG